MLLPQRKRWPELPGSPYSSSSSFFPGNVLACSVHTCRSYSAESGCVQGVPGKPSEETGWCWCCLCRQVRPGMWAAAGCLCSRIEAGRHLEPEMCFPPTCKCLKFTITGSTESLKKLKCPQERAWASYLPMSCWGPERIHTMEGEHQESKGKSCQHLLELNSASLTGPWGIPPGSHHVCSAHVLACLDGPSQKHSGCFRMCWLCTRNRERGVSVLSLRNVLSWWKHGSNTLMLLPFFFFFFETVVILPSLSLRKQLENEKRIYNFSQMGGWTNEGLSCSKILGSVVA